MSDFAVDFDVTHAFSLKSSDNMSACNLEFSTANKGDFVCFDLLVRRKRSNPEICTLHKIRYKYKGIRCADSVRNPRRTRREKMDLH